MIRIVGGLPGSGKSYYAANFISKYGSYDNLYKNFDITKDVQIFTNLDDLQVQHQTLEGCFERAGGIEKFFTVETFTAFRDLWPKAHILVIIDEAQKYIDDALLKIKEVAYFFQYHRHLGVDIFLLTNDIASCSKKVVGLGEFVIEAQPRSKGLPGIFRYKFKDTKGTHLFTESVRLKNEVFSIYKSFTTDESEKPKNVIVHWLLMLVAVILVAVVGYKMFVNKFLHRSEKKPVPASTVYAPTPSNPVVMPPPAQAPPAPPVSAVPQTVPQSPPAQPTIQAPPPSPAPVYSPVYTASNVPASRDLPRVVGLIGDSTKRKYLLSTGEIVSCKRQLNINDIYIR